MASARVFWRVAALALIAACASRPPLRDSPPALLLGTFVDDYGSTHTITAREWRQQPRARYRIVRWNVTERYLLAQNDSANPSAAGLWTRIDWMEFAGMPPFHWGFCFSAYRAPSLAVAETVSVARRNTPRTGCDGYPFSRMRRAAPDSALRPAAYPGR
ncbi:MAG: hypothetical protein ACT4P6_03490 [Gemmatimonadaceae bacterium]